MNPRILSSLLLAVSLACAASPSLAQPADPGPDVRALLDEAARAAQAGDHATALDRFRAAYARYKSAAILLNIGTALHRLGRYPEAAIAYEQYLRDPAVNPDRIADVRRALADVEGRVARVTVGASDPEARVWVDGAALTGFAMGGTLRLSPGEHVIAAGREGPMASERVRVAAGEARSVFLKLAASPALPPPAPVPIVVIPGPPGPEPPPSVVVVESGNGGQVATGLLVGVGGLAFAGGLISGLYALVRNQDASRHCLDGGAACDAEGVRIDKQVKVAANISSVTLGVGSALLITGAIVGAATRTRGRAAATLPRVAVTPIAGGAFAALEASW